MEIPTNDGNGGSSVPNRPSINRDWILEQHSHQQELNAQLLQALHDIRATLHTPAPEPAPTPVYRGELPRNKRPKHSLSHPNKFDGLDRSAYPAFKGYLQVKFRIDSEAIGGETEKVWYGYGYLIGKAAERIFPWLAAAEEKRRPLRVEDFFTQLDAAFSDPQSAQRALEWINSKKQGSQPFREFLQEFEQKLLEAGGWEFSDGVRKGYLRSAVSRKIKEKLVAVEEPAKYEDFVNQLRRTSDNLAELDRLSNRKTWSKAQEPEQDAEMDWEPTAKVSKAAPNRPRSSKALVTDQPQAKWVSKETLDRRRANQECLRCGETDHFISKCRYGPAKKPARKGSRGEKVAAAETTPKGTGREKKKKLRQAVVIGESSSDEGSESDSGNE
jgi:hypothetical protein